MYLKYGFQRAGEFAGLYEGREERFLLLSYKVGRGWTGGGVGGGGFGTGGGGGGAGQGKQEYALWRGL
jgi:hypothetical protein